MQCPCSNESLPYKPPSMFDILEVISVRNSVLLRLLLQECRVNESLTVGDLLYIIRVICEGKNLGKLLHCVTWDYAHEVGIHSCYRIVFEDGTREKRFTYVGFFIQQIQYVIDTGSHKDYLTHLLDLAETILPPASIRNTSYEPYVEKEVRLRQIEYVLVRPRPSFLTRS
jgi:hypothetical protein